MKKRLLITASTFPRYEKDTEPRFILDLAKSLLPYYDVTVLAPAAPESLEEEVMEGVNVRRYHYFPIHKLETLCYPGAIVPRIKQKKTRILLVPWLFLALFHYLRKHRKEYDLVHANWLIPQGIIQAFTGIPYIVTGHGADVTSLNAGLMKSLKKRCLNKAEAVTAVSWPLMDVLEELCPGKRHAVISMGVNTASFGMDYRVENYFNQQGKPVVLFVGRLAEKKGVRYLIEAMQNLKQGKDGELPVKLVIAGDGPLQAELKQQASEYGDQILFLGSKTHEELKTIYASADLFVMPSVTASDGDKEGFGLVMLEAFASGLPVVASDSGGIHDLIHHEENGLLVKEKDSVALAEAIKRVLSDENLYESLKCNGQKTVSQYDYAVIGRKYADLIDKVL